MSVRDLSNPIDHLDSEDIRLLFDRAVQNEAADNQLEIEREAAKDFLEAHPEYIKNPRNGTLMETAIEYSGTKVRSFEDIEAVYNDLAARGLLELDANVMAQQEQEARRARIQRARGFRTVQRAEETAQDFENDAWTMPLEQLEALANQEAREQYIRDNDAMPAGFDAPRPSGFRSRRRSGI